MLDLVLHNAVVIDGSGRPPFQGSVGIRGDRIAVVGEVDEIGRREVDVEGLVVSPGFIDLHTHYDAQIFWDPFVSPSPSHGVTTVISGNCGLTLAPMKPENRDFAIRLLANVEGIPAEAIAAGVEFRWESFPELMDCLGARPLAVNLGVMVGHSAIRRHVMGESASSEPASEGQLEEMCALLDEALGAGGFGFSTATAPTHKDGDGRPTPPNFASQDEFVALSTVCGRHPGTSLEFIARSSQQGFDDADRELMAAMSRAADRVLNWNTPVISKEDPSLHLRQLAACRMDAEAGVCIVPMMMSQNNALYYDLKRGYVHRTLPGWNWLFDLDLPERVKVLREPAVRRGLLEGINGGSTSTALRLRRWEYYEVVQMGPPHLRDLLGKTVGEIARSRGQDPYETWVDLLVETEFDIGYAIAYYPGEDAWVTETRREVLADPRVMVGASDGGAHMDMLVGGSSALRTLIEWVYERELFSLEQMIRLLSDVPARLYGLHERGRVEPGYVADLLVLDPERLGVSPMRVADDLPAGAPRLISNALGIESVIVSGTEVFHQDEPTGELPGRLLRSGRDSATVTPSSWIRTVGADRPQ